MPQLIGMLVLGAIAWMGYRWLRKEMTRVQSDLREADEALKRKKTKNVTTLEQDPETGEYKPSDE